MGSRFWNMKTVTVILMVKTISLLSLKFLIYVVICVIYICVVYVLFCIVLTAITGIKCTQIVPIISVMTRVPPSDFLKTNKQTTRKIKHIIDHQKLPNINYTYALWDDVSFILPRCSSLFAPQIILILPHSQGTQTSPKFLI